jgi:hypothetical protein
MNKTLFKTASRLGHFKLRITYSLRYVRPVQMIQNDTGFADCQNKNFMALLEHDFDSG